MGYTLLSGGLGSVARVVFGDGTGGCVRPREGDVKTSTRRAVSADIASLDRLSRMRLPRPLPLAAPLLRPFPLVAQQHLHRSTPPLLFGKSDGEATGDPQKCPFVGGQNSFGDFNLLTAGATVLAIVAVRMLLRRATAGLPHLVAWLSLPSRRSRALLADARTSWRPRYSPQPQAQAQTQP